MSFIEDTERRCMSQFSLNWWDAATNFDVAVHYNNSGRIIINCPGYQGTIGGYNDKYEKMAFWMRSANLGAVVRMGYQNQEPLDRPLCRVIDYALYDAINICGSPHPELFLMGTSAGAGIVAAIAHRYKEVSRILLIAPGWDMGVREIEDGLPRFRGEVYLVIGKQDTTVYPESAQRMEQLVIGTSKHHELFEIDDCDHWFTKPKNGMILSKAPFYAFSKGDKPSFPDHVGGMLLYP